MLRILLLEDLPADAELTLHALAAAGVEHEAVRVETREEFCRELERLSPDVILADYSLPTFSGPEALAITRASTAELPFIVVSGAVGDERAIELLRAGATDFVLKHRLERLGPAVQRALAEVRERRARQRAEEALREANQALERRVAERTRELAHERDVLAAVMANTRTQLAYLDRDFNFVRVNRSYAAGTGYREAQLVGRNHFELFPNAENEAIFRRVRDEGDPITFLARPFVHQDEPRRGTTYWDWSLVPVRDGAGVVQGLVLSLADVSDRVRDVLERERLLAQVQADAEEMQASNIKLAMAGERLERQNAELEVGRTRFALLSRTASLLLSSHAPLDEIGVVCREVMDALGCAAFFNYLADESNDGLRLHAWSAPAEPASRIALGEGACGASVQLGEPVVIERAHEADNPGEEMARAMGLHAIAAHPLFIQGASIGCLTFGCGRRAAFSADELTLMRTVADQVATALERARLLAEAQSRARQREHHLQRLGQLIGVAEQVLVESALEGMLQRIADATRTLTDARLGLCAHGWGRGAFRAGASSRREGAHASPPGDDLGVEHAGPYMALLEGRASVRLSGEDIAREVAGLPDRQPPPKSLLVARLVGTDARSNGLLLAIDKDEGEFSRDDEALLAQLAALASLALQHLEARNEAGRRAGEIAQQRDFHERLMEAAPVAVAVLSLPELRFEYASPTYRRRLGSEAVGRTLTEVLPHSGEQLAAALRPSWERGEPAALRGFEAPGREGGPSSFWNVDSVPLPVAEGESPRFLMISTDVTAERESRRQIEETAARDEAILGAINDGILITSPDGTVLSMNPAALRMHGWEPDTPLPRVLAEFAPRVLTRTMLGAPLAPAEWPLARVLAGETVEGAEIAVEVADSGRHWVASCNGTLVRDAAGAPLVAVLSMRDVSERVAMEAALRESEERFRTLAEAIPQIAWSAGPDGAVEYYNQRVEILLGRPREAFYEHGWPDLLHPGDREATLAAWRHAVATGEAYQVEHRLLDAAGNARWYLSRGVPVRDEANRVVRWFGTATDIHDQKQAEAALERRVAERTADLERSEALLRKVLDTLPVGVWITDEVGTIVHGNPAGQAIWAGIERVPPERYGVYKGWWTDTGAPIAPEAWALARAIARGETSEREQIEIECFDGSRKIVLNWAGPIYDATGRLIAAIAMNEDITEQVMAERQLRSLTRRLRILHDIDQAVLAATSPEAIAQLATEQLRGLVDCDRASVLLLEADGEVVRMLAVSSSAPTALGTGMRLPGSELDPPQPLLDGNVILTGDLEREPLLPFQQRLREEGLRSQVIVPLLSGDRLIGTLNLASIKPYAFAPESVAMTSEVAASLAVALEHARVLEQLRSSRERLQHLSRRLVGVQEEERRLIARELHDEAGQSLTALLLGLGMLERESQGRKSTLARLQDLKALTDSVMEGLHRLAMNLRPAVLDRLGLVPAVRQLLESLRAQGLETDLIVHGISEERLEIEIEVTLLRVIQEATTNVLRHARARRAGIILEQREGRVVAVIEDDGDGFDSDAAASSGRLGLAGMRERVELVGGRLEIESAAGGGTTVYVEIPLVAVR